MSLKQLFEEREKINDELEKIIFPFFDFLRDNQLLNMDADRLCVGRSYLSDDMVFVSYSITFNQDDYYDQYLEYPLDLVENPTVEKFNKHHKIEG